MAFKRHQTSEGTFHRGERDHPKADETPLIIAPIGTIEEREIEPRIKLQTHVPQIIEVTTPANLYEADCPCGVPTARAASGAMKQP